MKVLADAMKRAGEARRPVAPRRHRRRRRDSTASPARSPSDRTATPIGKKLVIEEIKNGQLTLKATIDPAKGGKVEMNNGPRRRLRPLRRRHGGSGTDQPKAVRDHDHGLTPNFLFT